MTVGFDTETGLTKALETAVNYNILMRDMPISPLLTANDIEGIRSALLDIFAHLRKVRVCMVTCCSS
jgi:dynein heavy chain 1, cytosolic